MSQIGEQVYERIVGSQSVNEFLDGHQTVEQTVDAYLESDDGYGGQVGDALTDADRRALIQYCRDWLREQIGPLEATFLVVDENGENVGNGAVYRVRNLDVYIDDNQGIDIAPDYWTEWNLVTPGDYAKANV